MKPFYVSTAYCDLRIYCTDQQLLNIDFVEEIPEYSKPENALQAKIRSQIDSYCRSGDFVFDLPLAPVGTVFQQRIWQAIRAIPAGQVRRYGEIANELHSSARAVGNACRANPIPLVIPCHRVVAASGIGGYAGDTGGQLLEIKRRLLRHEGVEI